MSQSEDQQVDYQAHKGYHQKAKTGAQTLKVERGKARFIHDGPGHKVTASQSSTAALSPQPAPVTRHTRPSIY